MLKRVLAVAALVGTIGACGGDSNPTGSSGGTLEIVDLTVGTGATAVAGDTVTVNYELRLANGTLVDSSYVRGQPFPFRLGTGAVIAGFDQGVTGMRVGGKRRLTIPPSLGYGSQPRDQIPANSTLIFEVELLSIAGK